MGLIDGVLGKLGYVRKDYTLKNPKHVAEIFGLLNQTTSGANVSDRSSLEYSGYYSPLVIRCRTLMVLPKLVLRITDRGLVEDRSHDQHFLLKYRPNKYQSSSQFFFQLQFLRLHRGNGIAWMEGKAGLLGRPTAWHLLENPESALLVFVDGEPFLHYRGLLANGRHVDFTRPYSEFIHVPNDVCNGVNGLLWGEPGWKYARETIGMGLAVRNMMATFIHKNGWLFQYFSHPEMLTVEQRDEIADQLAEYLPGGEREDEWPFFTGAMELKSSSMNIKDVDADSIRRFSIEDAARYNVFPNLFKMGHQDNSNYANSYQQSIDFRDTTILPDITPLQEELGYKTMRVSEFGRTHKVNIDVKALLDADPEMRAKFYGSLVNSGVMSRNEVLQVENMPTMGPEGDLRTVQVQNIPLNQLMRYWEAIIHKTISGKGDDTIKELEGMIGDLKNNGNGKYADA